MKLLKLRFVVSLPIIASIAFMMSGGLIHYSNCNNTTLCFLLA